MSDTYESNAVTVTIIANGDDENTPAEAVHHALEYARKAGFIEAWSDPVCSAQQHAPVAWLCEWDGHKDATANSMRAHEWEVKHGRKITPLYAAPVASTDTGSEGDPWCAISGNYELAREVIDRQVKRS